jgi:acyl-coenzyme A synthetase/AMP-(fatty) acid ligase
MLSHALIEHDVTLVAGVPPLLRLLAEAATGRPTRRIGYLSAGMPMDARTAELVGTVLGGWLGEVYGTTETGPICVRPPVPWQDAHSLGQPLGGSGSSCARWSRGRSRRPTTRPGKGQV